MISRKNSKLDSPVLMENVLQSTLADLFLKNVLKRILMIKVIIFFPFFLFLFLTILVIMVTMTTNVYQENNDNTSDNNRNININFKPYEVNTSKKNYKAATHASYRTVTATPARRPWLCRHSSGVRACGRARNTPPAITLRARLRDQRAPWVSDRDAHSTRRRMGVGRSRADFRKLLRVWASL